MTESCQRCGDFITQQSRVPEHCQNCAEILERRWTKLWSAANMLLGFLACGGITVLWYIRDRTRLPQGWPYGIPILTVIIALYGPALFTGAWFSLKRWGRAKELASDHFLLTKLPKAAVWRWVKATLLLGALQSLRIFPSIQRIYSNDRLEELGWVALTLAPLVIYWPFKYQRLAPGPKSI